MDEQLKERVGKAIGRIPSGLFIMTAAYEARRTGMLTSWVQQVAFKPPMVSVAIGKGRPILPLIGESRHFGLCQLSKNNRTIMRKFAAGIEPDDDPFLGFEMREPASGQHLPAPVLEGVLSYLICQVVCHVDLDADHDLFVGQVKEGELIGGEPDVRLRSDGFGY